MFREEFDTSMQRFFSSDGLEQCDDIAQDLVSDTGLPLTMDEVKSRHADFPCVWTFSLLGRLSQYAQTIEESERESRFAPYADVLAGRHPQVWDASN